MHKRRIRPLGWALTSALSISLTAALGAAAHAQTTADPGLPDSTGATAGKASKSGQTITLITGDRVTVRGGNAVSIEAGEGRAHTQFISEHIGGHLHVIPVDALGLIQAGRVDPRLFDLTTLRKFGYDDRRELPLLVTYPAAGQPTQSAANAQAAAKAGVLAGKARIVRELPIVGALAIQSDPGSHNVLWRSLTQRSTTTLAAGVQNIWLDGKRKVSLDKSVPQIGAPTAWKAGLTGKGVTVAVLDTGIDATHPDLATQVVAEQNFTDSTDTRDTVGHGTHVASIIAGTGAASKGRYRGVAPGARLLDGKVCADTNCADSAILAGMEWAASRAKVVNMSLGDADTPGIDPLEKAVNDLSAQYGTLFVIAAGNDGAEESVNTPAAADAALAVGAVDRKDQIAFFSSRGPRLGDDAIKPEITAPGVNIVAAKSAVGTIGDPAPNSKYTTLSGTSMATPHVAGAAAILTQQHPDWSAQQRKATLLASANPTAKTSVFAQGAGRVDVAREIRQTMNADPPAISLGRQLWPHDDDTPITRTITYHNTGAKPVTLNLTVQGTGPNGKPAPAGMFTLKKTKITVPASGNATAQLTADTRVTGAEGAYSGYVQAVSGSLRVETPFGVEREAKSHDLTLVHTDRDGAPAKLFRTVVVNLKTGAQTPVGGRDATITRRLPEGDYALYSLVVTGNIDNEDPTDNNGTVLVNPRLPLRADAAVNLDARLGQASKVTVPHADAKPVMILASGNWHVDDRAFGVGLVSDSFDRLFTAQLGEAFPGFTSSLSAALGQIEENGARNSPYTYDLYWRFPERMFAGFTAAVAPSDLVTIQNTYARQATGASGFAVHFPLVDDGTSAFATAWVVDLPFTQTAYVNAGTGVHWRTLFEEALTGNAPDEAPTTLSLGSRDETSFQPGHTYQEGWNRGPFGPSVNRPDVPEGWAARDGNTISSYVPMLRDRDRTVFDVPVAKARTALYRNGKLVKRVPQEDAEFTVPPANATYRLEHTVWRNKPHTLSTYVHSAWTFKSRHVNGTTALPLSSVGFTAPLDLNNAAPAGQAVKLEVAVERASTAPKNKKLTVEVSYDDGKTWKKVAVQRAKEKLTVVLTHPSTAGYVALRAKATDAAGSTVVQTIKRAYRIA